MASDPAEGSGPLRIGLFGGTFDPPHRAHTAVAADVADALELDRVLWMPAGDPPHKPDAPITAAPIRLEMVRAATEDDPRFAVSAMEIRREGASYSVDTLRDLRAAHPEAELFLIVGADQYRVFETWHEPEAILGLCTLAVMDRGGVDASEVVPPVAGAEHARFVPVRRIDLSATEIRERVRSGGDVAADVAEGVAELIEREGLYRG